MAVAFNANYQAAKNAAYVGTYDAKCVVCGRTCKASIDVRMQYMCAGCHQPFHTDTCGVYYACNKCIATLPPDERNAFTKQMQGWRTRGNFAAGCLIPPVFILGLITFFSGNIAFLGIALIPLVIAIAVLIPLGAEMRDRANEIFVLHPVPKAEPLKGSDSTGSPQVSESELADKERAAAAASQAVRVAMTDEERAAADASRAARIAKAPRCKWCGRIILDTKVERCPDCANFWH